VMWCALPLPPDEANGWACSGAAEARKEWAKALAILRGAACLDRVRCAPVMVANERARTTVGGVGSGEEWSRGLNRRTRARARAVASTWSGGARCRKADD
jgi:acetyl-CoA carboxylase beta subunit